MTQQDVDAAVAALQADPGRSKRSVADELGVNESTLRTRLRNDDRLQEAGIPSRGDPVLVPESIDPEDPDVEIPVIDRYYTDLEELYCYSISDVHKGSSAHHHDKWLEWLAYIEDTPETSLLLNGDLFNAAIVGSKSDGYTETMTVQDAKYELVEDLKKVADKVDAINPGNHEDRVWRATGSDPTFDVANLLGIEGVYFNPLALIRYHVGDQVYTNLTRHGTGGGGKRIGGKANNLADMVLVGDADIYTMGHTHTQLAFPQERFTLIGDNYTRRRQYFVGSGSFLKYEDYAAGRGFAPTKVGAPRIRLDGTRHDIHVSI